MLFTRRFIAPVVAPIVALALSAQLCTAQVVALKSESLQVRIDRLEQSDTENLFELGTMQVLRAVETSLQTRYEYGLGQEKSRMPMLRLPLPGGYNPAPKAPSPETLSNVVRAFLSDLEVARATLEKADAQSEAGFPLPLAGVWLDANSNGTREAGEGALELLGAVVLGRRGMRDFEKSELALNPPTVDFDKSDLAWLTAYTHMLSGVGNAYLAFDPTDVWANLAAQKAALKDAPQIENYFDQEALKAELARLEPMSKALNDEVEALRAEQKPINTRNRDIKAEMRKPETKADPEKLAALKAEQTALTDKLKPLRDAQNKASRAKRAMAAEIRALKAKTDESQLSQIRSARNARQFSEIIDRIYVVLTALAQQPDKAHVTAAYAHWQQMIAHNRTFWTRVEAETDNGREWVPNPQQTAALPITIDPEVARTWQNILADAEAVLEGKLLIPHSLLPAGYGINLKSYVENPTPLELAASIQGIAFYEHVARGPTMSSFYWSRLARLTGGNAGNFALFFN